MIFSDAKRESDIKTITLLLTFILNEQRNFFLYSKRTTKSVDFVQLTNFQYYYMVVLKQKNGVDCKQQIQLHFFVIECGWRDSNPHASQHQILSLACLPISPHPLRERKVKENFLELTRFSKKYFLLSDASCEQQLLQSLFSLYLHK